MTKLLEEAIAKLKTLSEERQDRIAGLLLHLAEDEAVLNLDGSRWLSENKSAIEAYNNRVSEGSILSDFDRAF
jgi:hypothetical protein